MRKRLSLLSSLLVVLVAVVWAQNPATPAAIFNFVSRNGAQLMANIVPFETLTVGNGTGTVTVSTWAQTSHVLTLADKAQLTADFTDINSASLQAITGLSFALPSGFFGNLSFQCQLAYSQATPVAGNQFGVAMLTTAPTRLDAYALVATNVTTSQYGPLNNLTSTTPTAIVTFTTVPSTVLPSFINGTVQVSGAGASTLQFYVLNGTAADVIVVKAGSFCTIE